MKKNVETTNSVKVVTANTFISAKGLPKMTIKARKLLLLAIGQCRLKDTEFSEYSISTQNFADLMGIASSNLYQSARMITRELMKSFIEVECLDSKGKPGYIQYRLFSKCTYADGQITFLIDSSMKDLLLGLKKDFSQPLLADFMRMSSPYSIAIWHLMQREMKSKKPGVTNSIEFELSLEELRQVTGTDDKLEKISNFKNRVLNKAIREIKDNCGVDITYTNIKDGRFVTGFRFSAVNTFHLDLAGIESSLSPDELERIRQRAAELNSKKS